VLPRDRWHGPARALFADIQRGRWSSVHTSDLVLAEALNFLRRKVHRREAERTVLALAFGKPGAPPAVTDVLRVHAGRFAQAVERYERHFDQRLSFTDCSTLVLVEELRPAQVATFDRGFQGLAEVVPHEGGAF
jgi:predicted nucleic acid-binding protein